LFEAALSVPKPIIIGNFLKKGDHLFCYIVNSEGRKGIFIPLDGKEICHTANSVAGV